MSSLYSIGSMNQLGDAFENNGFTPDDITKLKQFGSLKGIQDILNGKACIHYPSHLINCDITPIVTNKEWFVKQHNKDGLWKFNPKKVVLYLSEKQQKEGKVSGMELRAELRDTYKHVLNDNVLDYLLEHQEIIPEDWRDKKILFWGTLYSSNNGFLSIYSMYWDGFLWHKKSKWVDWDRFFNASYFSILAK